MPHNIRLKSILASVILLSCLTPAVSVPQQEGKEDSLAVTLTSSEPVFLEESVCDSDSSFRCESERQKWSLLNLPAAVENTLLSIRFDKTVFAILVAILSILLCARLLFRKNR